MKKVIIAAVLAAAGFAHAQSNVSLYGTLDSSIVRQSGQGLQASNVNSATTTPSNFGIKGKEDLGSARVGFNFEAQVDFVTGNVGSKVTGPAGTSEQNAYAPTAGTSTMFSRKANIDLESQYGLVTIGRQPTAFFAAFPKADALGIASGGIANVQSNLVNSGRTGNGMLSAQTGPMNPDASINAPGGLFAASYSNGIGYKTPTISGFTGNFFYGFAPASPVTGSNDWEPQSQKNYVVSFEQGPWDAQLGYQSIRDNTGSKLLSNSLADIGYTFGAVTIKATRYQGSFGKCSQNTLGGNCQTKALSIATTGVATAATYAPIGTPYGDNFAANGLGVSVQVTPKTRAALQFTAVDDKNSARADNQVRMVTAFADYKFSKRTSVYALVSHVDNRGTANYSPIFSVPAQAPSTGTNITAYGFGLRTSF